MSYSDAKYAARVFVKVSEEASFGTTTASATDGANISPTCYLPQFDRRTKINALKMTVTTIPDTGSTALKAHYLNGTDTFAVVTLTTATAGQVLAGTISTSYNTFTADSAPTVKVTGTASASGDAQGSYDIYFEQQELFE
jgi:hypothetical protein